MRFGQLFSIGCIVSGLLLSATGCVCMNGGGCSTGGCQSVCDPCSGKGEFYAGGPLARIVGWQPRGGCDGDACGGCKVGCGAGCGELYVDEWVNERPTVDNCGCGECLTCGRQPVRSLLRLLWGDRYCGSCETGCDDGGVDLGSPVIHDGYDPGAWSANRGCNCGGQATRIIPGAGGPMETETSVPSGEVMTPQPPMPVPSPAEASGTGLKAPTPAPPMPKSALRLNPATRRVMR